MAETASIPATSGRGTFGAKWRYAAANLSPAFTPADSDCSTGGRDTLGVSGLGSGVPAAGRDWHLPAGVADYPFHSAVGLGGSPGLTTPAGLAGKPHILRPDDQGLAPWRRGAPPCQVDRHSVHGCQCRLSLGQPGAKVGDAAGLRVHGSNAAVAVAQAGTLHRRTRNATGLGWINWRRPARPAGLLRPGLQYPVPAPCPACCRLPLPPPHSRSSCSPSRPLWRRRLPAGPWLRRG